MTELDHALQAATLADAEGAPAELVAVVALLHDVGHLVVGDLVPLDRPLDGDAHHEAVGARHLRRWFGPAVTDPVALHVAAKRYLCAVDAGYHAGLSPSSVRSLEAQGGPDVARGGGGLRGQPPERVRPCGCGAGTTRRRWPASTWGIERWVPVLEALVVR